MMAVYRFRMQISYEQFLPFYQGRFQKILVTDTHGKKIELPAEHFRGFLTRDGISGFFELKVSPQGKFIALVRIN